VNGLPAAVLSVVVQARGIAETNARLTGLQGGLKATEGAATRMGKQLAKGLKIAALGAAAALAAAVKSAVDYDKEMRNVNSIAQLSERRFGNLKQKVLALAGPTAQAPKTLAAGLYDLVSSGFNAHEGLQILAKSARAATAGLTTTEVATKAVSAVLNAYELSAKAAGSVSDILFKTVERGVIEFPELANTIGDVLPYSSQLGIGLNEVGAAISTMTKAGINAPETMTRLKSVMVTLLKPGKDLHKLLSEMGATGEALLEQRGFLGALEAIVSHTDGTKEAIAGLFPDVRALGGVMALTGIHMQSARQDLQAFSDTAGATNRALSQQEKSTAFQLQRLKAEVEVLAIGFGEKLLPEINKVIQVITDPHLTTQQKFSKVFGIISKAAQQALDAAVHLFNEYGGKMIGALIASMAKAWWSASPLGKLLSLAGLVRVIGGKGAVVATGQAIGRWLGFGISEGAAETITITEGAGAAAGLGSSAASGAAMSGWLGTDKPPPAAAAAGEFGERQALQDAGLLGAGAGATGALGGAVATGLTALGGAAGGYFAAEFGAKAIEGITGADLLENQDLKTSLLHGFNTSQVASTEEKALNKVAGIHPSLDKAAIKKLEGTYKVFMGALRVSSITGMAGVNQALSKALEATDALWINGTKSWRQHTALAMTGAVAQIATGMKNGTIPVKQGKEEINRLLRQIHLIRGDDPLGLADATTKSFKQANAITASGVKSWIRQLEKMPQAARESTIKSTLGMLRAWADGHPKIEAQVKALTANVLNRFNMLETKGKASATDLAIGVAGSFGSMGGAVATVLELIKENTNHSLGAFGADPLTYAINKVGNLLGLTPGSAQGKQQGGFIVPGTGSGDRPGFMGEVGAYVLNREATRAYGFNQGGMVPLALEPGERYFTRREVKAMGGAGTLEAMNRSVPRQHGGPIGKPEITGPAGPLLDIGQGVVHQVEKVAHEYLAKHKPKGGTGYSGPAFGPAGTSMYKGVLMATWVRQALEYAAGKGVSPQPTSGYRTEAESAALGFPHDEHTKARYPGGAVDFGGMVDPAAAPVRDAVVAATRSFKYPLLHPIGFHDDGHASGTGHQLGGLIHAFAQGGRVSDGLRDFLLKQILRTGAPSWSTVRQWDGLDDDVRAGGDPARLYRRLKARLKRGYDIHEDLTIKHPPKSLEPGTYHPESPQQAMLGGLIQALSAGGSVPTSSGQIVGASTYGGPADDVSGTVGAAGVSLPGKMSFAELAMGKALGGLPFHAKLKIGHAGRSVIAEKLDIGAGGGDVGGHNRAIDLWYQTAEALGLPNAWLGTVKVSSVDGSSTGLTSGQKKAAEGKQRKLNNERHLQALMGEVASAHSLPAKQSKLWRLIKFWGRVGIFDKEEHSHIIDAVQSAAAQTKPQGAVSILGNLADYAKGHGEITGQDPSNFRSMGKAIERAQKRGLEQRKKAVERQKKHVEAVHGRVASKIAKRAAFPDLVAQIDGMRHSADAQEEYASQLVTLEPENLGDSYVDQERGAYKGELDRLLGWRNNVVRAQEAATAEIGRFQKQLAEIEAMAPQANVKGSGKGAGLANAQALGKSDYSKVKYKIPLLKEAIENAKTMRDETWAGELEEIQGLNGPGGILAALGEEPVAGGIGGRIFETQNSIRELALKTGNAQDDTGRLALVEQLAREANQRAAISEAQRVELEGWDQMRKGFAGFHALGGKIPAGMWGIAGEQGPEPVVGPATVMSNREGREVFGGGMEAQAPTVIVNGDIVQEKGDSRDPVEVVLGDKRFAPAVQKAARSGRGTGRSTPGGARR